MLLSFAPFIFASQMLIAATGLPVIDPQHVCHASDRAMPDLGGKPMQSFDSCMRDEQEAGERLLKDWMTYSSSDKALCIHPKDYLPSYIEWVTCAEMARDMRRIRKEKPASRP
jgi:hypothetical protein